MRLVPSLLFALIAATSPARAAEPLRVLFIGNSYTFVNNVPALLEAVAAQQGASVDTDMLVAPAATLDDFVEAETVLERLARERWDAVVLQELGGHLACLASGERPRPTPCAASIAAHRKLAKLARAGGAQVIVFGTWSMTDGVQGLVSKGSRRVAGQVGAKLADVGWMLDRARKRDPALALFHPDRHLQPTGSVLAAIALWQALSGRSVSAVPFHAEVPVWPGAAFSLRRYVSEQTRRLPEPETLAIDLSAAQVEILAAAAKLD
ncbi:MAG TPA: hypothetical protein VND91_08070 [Candidatus Saccharimonadia bacterium]|nr:hypothetical protein [Candidatus Saccharimonadia bacterium]